VTDFTDRYCDTPLVRRDGGIVHAPRPQTAQQQATNARITIGTLRTLAVIAHQRGPERVQFGVDVDPAEPGRKRFTFEVDAAEFERVAEALGQRFGEPPAT
jgi:hypothetical protein